MNKHHDERADDRPEQHRHPREGRSGRGAGGPGGFGPGGFGPGGFGPGGFGPGGFGPSVRHGHGPGGFGPGGPRGRKRGRRGEVRESILILLAEEPLNGYQLMQLIAERTQGLWRPSPGAVYPALNQLEDEGLIEAFDHEGSKAFRLTETGVEAAQAITKAPWESISQAFEGRDPETVRGLWQECASLAGAARELVRIGSAEQLQAASQVVADARRSLYGLLATDPQDPDKTQA